MGCSRSLRCATYLLGGLLYGAIVLLGPGCGDSNPAQEFHSVSERTSSDNNDTVFASFGGTGQLFVFRIPNAGGSSTLLTQFVDDGDPNNDGGMHPFFSPDGSTVVYVANDAGNRDIWTMDRNGGSRTQLTTDPGSDMQPAFTPNGNQIVWVTNRSGDNDIWIMDSDGNNKRRLTSSTADEQWPSVGPGARLAYQSDDDSANGDGDGDDDATPDTDVYVATIPAVGTVTSIINLTAAGTFNEGGPSWDPTGTGAATDVILYHSDQSGAFDIWSMNADGSSKTQIIASPQSAGFPVWFPDGTRFTFTIAREAWHALPDGTDRQQITALFPS